MIIIPYVYCFWFFLGPLHRLVSQISLITHRSQTISQRVRRDKTIKVLTAVPVGGCAHPRCVYVMGRYAPSDSEKLRATFDGFDEDGSGMLDAGELKSLVYGLHLEMDVDEIKREMGSQNDDGEISFEVFSVWWCRPRLRPTMP